MLSAFNCFLTVSKRYESNIFVGYWSREVPEIAEAAGDKDGNYCVRWDQVTKQTYFDGAWRFGRTIGVLGAIISLLLLIFTFYIIFFRIGSRVFSYVLYASIFMSILSLFLLIGLSSDVCDLDDCKIGPGGWLAIFDFFWWVGASYVTYKLKLLSEDPEWESNPSLSRNQPPPMGTQPNVEKDQKFLENGDGTVTRVTTITTNKPNGEQKVDTVKRLMNKEYDPNDDV